MSQKCSYDPSTLIDVPLGMFHCPECGEMVLAGMAHPDYSLIETPPNNRLHLTAFGVGMRAQFARFVSYIQSLLARIGGK